VKLAEIKPLPNQAKDLDTITVDSLMKKSIEDVINKWKSELDNQVDKFETQGENLKNFELIFQKNFEGVILIL
jgi:hypothetical protein